MYTYDDINLSYDGINRYPCSLSETGWQRCADDNGDNSGGTYGAGKSLKAVGQGNGTDDVGFSAKLAGYRHTSGSFNHLSTYGFFWSSTPSTTSAWRRTLYSSYSSVLRYPNSKLFGFSIRCLRDTDDTSDFTDPRDGETYSCVKIGNQVWMTENLRYLPEVTPTAEWGSTTEPQYAVYNYTGTSVSEAKATSNYQEYGVLYNWPGAMASAPDGFHVPTDAETNELEVFVFNMLYKNVSYDGNNAFTDKNYDYQYAGENADRQLTITRTETDTLNTSDTGNRQFEISRIFTDTINISDSVKKALTRTVKDVINTSEMVYRTIAQTVTDTINITDKAFKSLSTTVSDTINISDNASRLLNIGRTVIDTILANEVIRRCLNGITTIFSNKSKNTSSFTNKTKNTSSFTNKDKSDSC